MKGELLRQLEEKFENFEESNGWTSEYQRLRCDASKQELDQKLRCNDAKSPKNIRSNRYRDVLPYDESRVRLVDNAELHNYINASLVPVPKAGRAYILTQGPLPETAADFWRMVWQEKTHLVIMLNKIIEKNTVKCFQYFPLSVDDVVQFEFFQIECVTCVESDNFVKREFLLKKTCKDSSVEERTVNHYQFITWPDFGVPARTTDFLEFLLEVRKSGLLNYKKYGYPIVHCSAGIGRSGTFVIVDAVLVMAELDGSVAASVDIFKLVLELRSYRMGLIQTPDQFRFCWQAVLDALRKECWEELVRRTCFDWGKEDERPQLSRGVGNELTSGKGSISVDCEEMETRKRSLPLPRKGNHHDEMDERVEEGGRGKEEEEEELIHPKSAKPTLSSAPGGGDGRSIGSSSSSESKEEKNARVRKKIDEIKRKMRESETSESDSWSSSLGAWRLLGAAACLFAGIALYFWFKRV